MMRILVQMTLLFLLTTPAYGAPFDISVSGRFVGTDGSPQVGPVDVQVKFFSAPTGGSSLGDPITKGDVQLSSGVFQLPMELTPKQFHNIFRGSGDVWVEMTDLTNGRTYPRQKYGAVPYALKVPVDGESLSFNGDGELEVSFPVADSGKRGSIKATSSYLSVDADGDITSLKADTATSATSFTGSLSGEVTGNQGSTVVSQIMGANVDTVTPSIVNQVMKWDGSKWYAGTDATVGSGAVDTVNNYGGGQEVMKDKSGSEVRFRTLVGVDGLTASTNGDTVEIGVGATSDLAIGSLTTNKQAALVAGPHNTGAGNTGEVRFQELAANGGDSVGFKSPDLLSGDLTWTLPNAAGTAGQALGLSGAGTLGWIDSNTSGDVQSASVGAVGAPSYTFTGDTDTGMYAIAPDKIGFATAGADRLTIGATGHVGIGSTSPAYSLDVVSSSSITAEFASAQPGGNTSFYISNTGAASTANGANIDLRAMTTVQERTAGRIQASFTDTTDATRDSRLDLKTTVNGVFAERLSIDGDGQVGIGTINPSRQLHIASDVPYLNIQDSAQAGPALAQPAIEFTTSDNTRIGFMGDGSPTGDIMMVAADTGPVRLTTISGQPIEFRTATTERMRIDGTGNVGIGTQTPGAKLEVEVPTATNEALILQTTDDDPTNNIFAVQDAGGTNMVRIDSNGQIHSNTDNNAGESALLGAKLGLKGTTWLRLEAPSISLMAPAIGSSGQNIDWYTGNRSVSFSGSTGRVAVRSTELAVNEDAETMNFRVESQTNQNAFLVDGTLGNVGISTNNPISPLHVAGNTGVSWASGAGNSGGLVTVGSADATGGSLWVNTPSANGTYQSGLGISGSYASNRSTVNINAYGPYATPYGSNLTFGTTNNQVVSEHMRIDKDGKVGIGTTNPESPLHVLSKNSSYGAILDREISTDGNTVHSALTLRRSYDSGPGADGIGSALFFQAESESEGVFGQLANIRAVMTDATPGTVDSYLGIGARSNSTSMEDSLVVHGSGNVGIGTTGPGEKVHVRGTDFVGLIVEATDADGTARFQVKNDAQEYRFGINNNDKFYIRDETATTNRLTIDTTGNMGLGTVSPDADAILELSSTTKGLLPPRMTTAQRDLITTPPKGLVIYNTTTDALNVYDGTWTALASGAGGGGLTSCPAGFTLIGTSGKRGAFCIDTVERGADSWFDAKDTCLALSLTEGHASMCSHEEWHRGCTAGTLTNATNNREWVNHFIEGDSTYPATLGNGSCRTTTDEVESASLTFRCCIR